MIEPQSNFKIETNAVNLFYGSFHALKDVTMGIRNCSITAIIGPSGCGKSSLLRLFNRTNDLIPGVKITGDILLDNKSIYGKDQPISHIRKRVGMVFQKPNVFPMSIYDNMIIGPKQHGIKDKSKLEEISERCLKQVAIWDEVKDMLKKSAMDLPAGQQQRLCIARALAAGPEVILMDESCSALDPESTMKIEELMMDLAQKYSIIIVTHSMEQARRVADYCAFMMIDDEKIGGLVEYEKTLDMFQYPKDSRTENYIRGRFG